MPVARCSVYRTLPTYEYEPTLGMPLAIITKPIAA